ncbi:MAG: helix-turn-helix domain-containing protein [Clostridiales bacterium]|nr:helix-turn-helix domain-containing protein [Clostridiales bacterium]
MIGERIRSIRLKNNLTLKELGKRTELSAAYLSNIENERTSPTLENLEKICVALQYDLSMLITESMEYNPLIRKCDRREVYRNTYHVRNELMTPYGVMMRGTCFTLFAGDNTEQVSLGHEHDEYFVVEKGRLKIVLNDSDEYIMEEGDAIYIRGRTPHRYRSLSDGDTILYVTTAMV